jgi:hypothetical protein
MKMFEEFIVVEFCTYIHEASHTCSMYKLHTVATVHLHT